MTRIQKQCRFGPFRGEFGHLLGHVLPFVTYLHSQGVEVDFCGLEIHQPFFVDSSGKSLVRSYEPLRDFFEEVTPTANDSVEPPDVKKVCDAFTSLAKRSWIPYWDISNQDYYFNHFRWWILKRGFMKATDLTPVYKTRSENSCVLFPRLKSTGSLENNGEIWDYDQVIECLTPFFETVYVVGHPAFSAPVVPRPGVEICLTSDNRVILEKCCNSRLIITPHSGTTYLGDYTDTPVLIIYQHKGSRKIGNFEPTRLTKDGLQGRHPFRFAFTLQEISEQIASLPHTALPTRTQPLHFQ